MSQLASTSLPPGKATRPGPPLQWLRCPFCSGAFEFQPAADDYGVLVCRCAQWPVVDGIPVIQRTSIRVYEHVTARGAGAGITAAELVRLIRSGRHEAALRACLAYPLALPALSRISWLLAQRAGDILGARRLRRVLRGVDRLTAREAIRFFFSDDSPMGAAVGDYFVMRTGQPRHLAALALLEQLPPSPLPILDLACGVGHFAHYLHAAGHAVLGVDLNFFQLWIARHWIAPQASYVCADLREPLPLADDSMAAAVCSDAYHYIPGRDQLLREVERCAPRRPLILTRIGNRAVMPNEGAEADFADYVAEIGEPLLAFDENGLLRDYLARRPPTPGDSGAAKWLSFMRHPPQPVVPSGWPHALGTLGFNPIYEHVPRGDGLQLRFRFPSIWYAYENAQMLSYHPRIVDLDRADLEQIRDPASALARRLTGEFVLVGLPAKFG